MQMNQAIKDNDGWLAHWYGSQIQKIYEIQEDCDRLSAERQRRMQEIQQGQKKECGITYTTWPIKKIIKKISGTKCIYVF